MKKKIMAMLLTILMCLPMMVSITANAASTDYKTWLQSDPEWGSIHLGTSDYTMKSSGCLVTSIAMLICHTGSADPSSFNPGTLVNYLNNNGGFTSDGALYWEKVNGAAEDFSLVNYKISLADMTQAEKTAKMKEYLDAGDAVIISVRNGGHWVALDRIEGNTVYMMDPASSNTNLYDAYDVTGVDRLAIYKGKYSSGTTSGNNDGSSSTSGGTGKVNCSSLNVRSGAGTNHSIVTTISRDTTVTILGEAKDNNGDKWYKISVNGKTGYVFAQYITLTSSGTSDSDSQQASGTGVVNCSSLNVRSGAGTEYSVVTTISRNQSVTITSKAKDSNGDTWYGVSFTKSGNSYKGYVFAEYITMDSNSDSNTSASGQIMTVAYDAVNVRSGAGTSKGVVCVVYKDEQVTVLGQDKDSNGDTWYKVETSSGKTGYIRSDLLKAESSDSGSSSSGDSEANGKKLQVIYDGVNMRKGAGTSYDVVEVIYLEDTLTVLGQDKDSSGNVWYKVKATSGNTGYIRYDMVKEAGQSSENQGTVSGTVTAEWLNVRSGAGTSYDVLVVIPEGTKVTIIETVADGSGSQWYHITVNYDGSNYNGYASAQYIQK
ncbi:MAG: SH3 domain-containing protein [Coprococcus sp.]